MRKITILTLMLVAILVGLTFFSGKAEAGETKITICHSHQPNPSSGNGGGPVGNPYDSKEVSISAVDGDTSNENGGNPDHYANHNGPLFDNTGQDYWGDIIPPVPGVHDGLNWTVEGQAIYNNGCNFVVVVPDDVCDNIDGIQTTVPDGYVEENGICTLGGQGGNPDPETPVTPETPVVTPAASTISTLPYTGNGLLEVLSALGLSAAALVATYFASVKSFKFLNR